MKTFFGYIRVSTARQGEHGVSLEHQREAIERYANKNNLQIAKWFEEQETADLPRLFQPVITEDFSTSANSFGVR
jgi:DNA invertase Pin-like site-specific DNA recombinase